MQKIDITGELFKSIQEQQNVIIGQIGLYLGINLQPASEKWHWRELGSGRDPKWRGGNEWGRDRPKGVRDRVHYPKAPVTSTKGGKTIIEPCFSVWCHKQLSRHHLFGEVLKDNKRIQKRGKHKDFAMLTVHGTKDLLQIVSGKSGEYPHLNGNLMRKPEFAALVNELLDENKWGFGEEEVAPVDVEETLETGVDSDSLDDVNDGLEEANEALGDALKDLF